MNEVIAEMQQFFAGTSIWVYVFIFLGRMFDVSAATLRIVLINRGERVVGSIVAFFEIIVWVFVTKLVLENALEDPLKFLVYAVAFALGTYVGSWLDDKLALGLSAIHVVVSSEPEAEQLQKLLHDNGYGVTAIDVHGGEDDSRYMFITNVRRKSTQHVIKIINSVCTNAVITISDVKTQKGGYFRTSVVPRK